MFVFEGKRGEFINAYDKEVKHMCRPDGYISGIHSIHSNKHEDRMWNFQCCYMKGTFSMCLFSCLFVLVNTHYSATLKRKYALISSYFT